MADKKPVKKKQPKDEIVIQPPIFTQGMTEEQAVRHIGQLIDFHRDTIRGKNNMAMKNGWSDEDLYIRHQLIINWFSKGMPNVEIHRYIREVWGVASSTATLYIKEAMKYLTQMSDEYRDDVRAAQVAKLERFAEECRMTGRYMEASKFLEQVNKIQGLYVENKKVELSADGPIKVTFEQ